MTRKRVLSGIQPTGEMHIGNYFGAVKNWVDIQEKYDCVYGVVDLHAMTMPYEPKTLQDNTIQMFIDLLACGIDPKKSVLFIQSLVPQHTELTWILNCVTSYGELSRMTQFKDKKDQLEAAGVNKGFVSAGLFTYPILQAADILIYRANYVPVGKDQEQHLELSRNIAVRFNNQFGEYFPEPKPLFTEVQKLMSLADPTKKMSKSLGDKHYISLFESEDAIRKKVRVAVTDTGTTGKMSPGVLNLFTIIRACGNTGDFALLNEQYKTGKLKYSDLKGVTADTLVETLKPFREKRSELNSDRSKVIKMMHELSGVARDYASKVLDEVKELTGLIR